MNGKDAMDRILINGLLIRCIIGVSKEERRDKQDVVVDLSIGTDTRAAAKTDRLADALDYRTLKKKILRLGEASRYRLLESLTEAIAALCMKESRIEKITVRAEKPGALRFARSVAVEITRRRQDLR